MKYVVILLSILLSVNCLASEPEYKIVLKNHRFEPTIITVPAGKKVKLLVENKDASADEFHSDALGVEKVISGNGKGVIFIGPLKPGKHSFMGEYHAATAQGAVIAK
jgi:plastocyanin